MNKELSDIITGFKRSISLIDISEKKSVLLASTIMLVVGVLTNLPAVILGKLVDVLINNNSAEFKNAIPYISIIIIIILIKEALTVARKYLVENVATQTEKKQTVAVIERLLKADLSNIHEKQIGSLHGQVFRSIQGLIKVIKLAFLEFLPTLFSGVVALIIVFYNQPIIGMVMFLVIPFGLYIVFKQIASQKGIRVSLLRGKEKIDGKVVETLHGLETVRVLDTTSLEVGKIDAIAEQLRIKEITHHIQMALYDSVKYLNEAFFYIATITLAIYLSAKGIISGGDILVFSVLFLSVTNPLREIHRILDQAHEGAILVNDLHELLNQPLDQSFIKTNSQINKVDNSQKSFNAVEVKNLKFSFGKVKVLNNVSFKVKIGEKIGIVGASGSGKSTLLKLILRLVHGYSGDIRLFDKNLNQFDRTYISSKIAYVPQQTFVFAGSIKDNVKYGCTKQNITDDQINLAIKRANFEKEVANSLGGLQGKVTENGNNLSGGQKQRLAIARLILQSPEIFIFDEATSALDTVNEVAIQENIEKYFPNKTMIIVAHRLSTLRDMDRILVFDKGKIVQKGSYSKLAKTRGLFADFLTGKKEIV